MVGYNLLRFFTSFSIAAPFSIISLPIIWLVLTKFLFPINFSDTGSAEKILFEIKEELGVMSREEKIVSLVFLLLVRFIIYLIVSAMNPGWFIGNIKFTLT